MRLTLSTGARKSQTAATMLVLAGWLAGAGCGSEPAAQGSPSPAPRKASASEAQVLETAPAEPRRSVFTVGKDVRDPFFPGSRKPEEPTKVAAEPVREVNLEDMKNVLTSGFQGIIGTTDRRMALIHNTVLEPRKTAEIVARLEGREYRLALRCLDVARDSVTVQVDGQPLPITISVPVKGTL